MLGVVAIALLAATLAMSGAALAQVSPGSGAAASQNPAQPAQDVTIQGNSPTSAQEPPSATAGMRIITRPQKPPAASQKNSPPASAEAKAQSSDTGNYLFERAGDKFLRLDKQTGQIALCNQGASGWDCRVLPEHPAALEQEIAQLRDDIKNLKELRQQTSDVDRLRAEIGALKQLPQQVADLKANLDQLRSETQDLKRLRAEVEDLKPLRAEVGGLNDLQTRIDDLTNQVAELRAAATAKKAMQDRKNSASETVQQGDGNAAHSSPRQAIDRATAFISDAWHRLVDMISNFQKEAMRRS